MSTSYDLKGSQAATTTISGITSLDDTIVRCLDSNDKVFKLIDTIIIGGLADNSMANASVQYFFNNLMSLGLLDPTTNTPLSGTTYTEVLTELVTALEIEGWDTRPIDGNTWCRGFQRQPDTRSIVSNSFSIVEKYWKGDPRDLLRPELPKKEPTHKTFVPMNAPKQPRPRTTTLVPSEFKDGGYCTTIMTPFNSRDSIRREEAIIGISKIAGLDNLNTRLCLREIGDRDLGFLISLKEYSTSLGYRLDRSKWPDDRSRWPELEEFDSVIKKQGEKALAAAFVYWKIKCGRENQPVVHKQIFDVDTLTDRACIDEDSHVRKQFVLLYSKDRSLCHDLVDAVTPNLQHPYGEISHVQMETFVEAYLSYLECYLSK